jgi:hypothetical protein
MIDSGKDAGLFRRTKAGWLISFLQYRRRIVRSLYGLGSTGDLINSWKGYD